MLSNRSVGKPPVGSTINGGPSIEKQFDYSCIPKCLQNELEFVVENFRQKIMNMMNSNDGGIRNRIYSNIHTYRNFNFRLMILPKVKLTSSGSLEGHISAYLEAVPSQNWPSNWIWINTRYTVTLVNQRDYRKSHFMSDVFSFKGENNSKKNSTIELRNNDYTSAGPESDRGWSDFFSLKTLLDPKAGFIDVEKESIVFRAGVFPMSSEPTSYGKNSMDMFGTDRSSTGHVGLRNLGATCYMNSLLQSLYHIGRFRKAVYSIPLNVNKQKNSLSNTPVSNNSSPLSTEIMDSQVAYTSPAQLGECTTPKSFNSEPGLSLTLLGNASEDAIEWTSGMARSLFEYENDGIASLESIISSNTSQDCGQGAVLNSSSNEQTRISSALQTLFYELQTNNEAANCRELMRSFGWDAADAFTQHDAQELNRLLCDRLEEEMKNTTVDGSIKALFEGEYENFIDCIDVDCTSRRRENFYDIQIDVEGVGSLQEGLDKFVEEEILDGENLYEAEGFGKQRARKGVRFQRFPPVLQFHLKRFQFNVQSMDMIKLNDYFTFPEELDLTEYICNSKGNDDVSNKTRDIYLLHTVVIHQGDVHSGHYYAYIRPKPDSSWYRFDDEKVTLVSSATAIEDNFGGYEYDVWDYLGNPDREIPKRAKTHSAYILVYVKESLASELLDEPIPQEVNPDLVSKYQKELEMMNLRKKLRQDFNEHVRVQLLLSTSYNISSSRPKLVSLHRSINTFPWNCIFKCPREYSLNQFHIELERRFIKNSAADKDRNNDSQEVLESHLFLLEGAESNHNLHMRGGDHINNSSCMSFYTCISSPSMSNDLLKNMNISGRSINVNCSNEILLSDLCKRYHREGLWDSSCPTLYMCLYFEDFSNLTERILPSYPNMNGSYLEKRQKIESRLRKTDEGNQILLLLRYFDIFDTKVNEYCIKYAQTQEISNLHNLGIVMVSQSTLLKDLNDYVLMEIEKEMKSGGIRSNKANEFNLRVCLESCGDQDKQFPLLDPRCTIQQLQLTNGSCLIFSWNLYDSVIKKKRDELRFSLEESINFPAGWLEEGKLRFHSSEDRVKLPNELENLKYPEFPVLDFHHWFENYKNCINICIYLWDPLDGEYRPSITTFSAISSLNNTIAESLQSSNNPTIRSFSRYCIKGIYNITLDLRWPVLKAWIYICNQLNVDPRSLALVKNSTNIYEASLLSIYSLLQDKRQEDTVAIIIRNLCMTHYYNKFPHNFFLMAIELKGHSFYGLNQPNKQIVSISCADEHQKIRTKYVLYVDINNTIDNLIDQIRKRSNILVSRGEDLDKILEDNNLRIFEYTNNNNNIGMCRGNEKIGVILNIENNSVDRPLYNINGNNSTLSLASFTEGLRLEPDYRPEELMKLEKGELFNVLIIQDSRECEDLPGNAFVITIKENSRLIDMKNLIQEKFVLDDKVMAKWRFYRFEYKNLQFVKDNDILTLTYNKNIDINIYGFVPHIVLLAQQITPVLQKSNSSRPLRI